MTSTGSGQRVLAGATIVVALGAVPPAESAEFAKPEVVRLGAGVADLAASLEGRCKTLELVEIDPPFLPDLKEGQAQIDCEGLPFRGRPRRVEFVIGDGTLRMVWILTTAEEETGLFEAMTAVYGEPTHRTPDYFAFTGHRAALRRDVPEVLFYSESLADVYGDWFDQRVAESRGD